MQDLKDKYILWASHKTEDYGTYVFWKKNAQGYTKYLEECHVYDTYEQAEQDALRNCYRDVVPIKIQDILPYIETRTYFTNEIEKVLFAQKDKWRNK